MVSLVSDGDPATYQKVTVGQCIVGRTGALWDVEVDTRHEEDVNKS